MLGKDVEEVGSEISDAIGEVCNMVAGNFKNKIPRLGDGCMLSPPSVIAGADYIVHAKPEVPTLQVSLLFEQMPMGSSLSVFTVRFSPLRFRRLARC
jgi:chemotaxis protein CheX